MWVGRLYLFPFLLHDEDLNPFSLNRLVRRIHGLAPEIEELTQSIFHMGFNWVSHINKIGTKSSNICVSISSFSLNGLHCWVVELMIFFCRSIGSNHSWNLIWKYVPYYCFSPPRRRGSFYSPSYAYPQLVCICDNMLCTEVPMSLRKICNTFACNPNI